MDTAVLLSAIGISLAIINILLVFILLKKNNNKDNDLKELMREHVKNGNTVFLNELRCSLSLNYSNEDLYEAELKKRVATSRQKENVKAVF